MLGLDHYWPYLVSAFGITLVVLVGYALYLRSRLTGARRRALAVGAELDHSGRNVTAAAPIATTAQAASSAKGPRAS